jgi:hypothetical protein
MRADGLNFSQSPAAQVLCTIFAKTFYMKKRVLFLVIFIVLAGLLAYRFLRRDKDPGTAEKKDQPLRISKNSGAFNTAFAGLLGDYYAVRDALVEWDTLKADQQAVALAQQAGNLPFGELKADSLLVLTARGLASSVENEANGLIGEGTIEQKRRSFNMLTDEVYNLVRTVRFDGQIIYHIRCPMAFNDSEEGFWLTNTTKIMNPYLGKKHPSFGAKMVGCGEVTDSVDFSK